MTLVDPKGGVTFSFGEKLSSTHMTTIFQQQPKAIDGSGGGNYALQNSITLTGGVATKNLIWDQDVGATRIYPGLTSHTVFVAVPLIAAYSTSIGGATNFPTNQEIILQNYVDTGAGPDPAVQIRLAQLLRGATLASILVGVDPVTEPARKTILDLKKVNSTSGAVTSLGTVTDTATGGGYTAAHTITLSGLSELISPTAGHTYSLKITGEGGAGASTGMTIFSVVATYTATTVQP